VKPVPLRELLCSALIGSELARAVLDCLMSVCAQFWLTQHCEPGRTGPHGSLDSLALKHCVIHQLDTLDSQMMLPWTVVANHCVTWIACSANTFVHPKPPSKTKILLICNIRFFDFEAFHRQYLVYYQACVHISMHWHEHTNWAAKVHQLKRGEERSR